MNKKIIAVLSALAVMATGFMAYAKVPETIPTEKEIFEGYDDGELHLERSITRAEFAKVFAENFLKDDILTEMGSDFSDVPSNFWGLIYIDQALNAGVIDGFEDGTFHPNENVKYEQAIKMLVKYCEKTAMAYPDGYISYAIKNGITDNVTSLIGDDISRNDIAILIKNMVEYNNKVKESNSFEYNGGLSVMGGASGGSVNMPAPMSPLYGTVSDESASSPSYNGVSENYIYDYEWNTEEYSKEQENIFKKVSSSPLSTFSIDADTASYSNMRRYILNGQTIPTGAIRSEELINYFDYDNPLPTDGTPFSVTTETAKCPWNENNNLAMISIQGAEKMQKQPSNLVFLVDVSGSMYSEKKLPLVKSSLKMMINELDEDDTISLVTYASGTSVVLESTSVSQKDKIEKAIDDLHAGGGTYGSAGVNLAYEQAEKNLIDGNNRIILCTDGDFNIGISSTGDLEKLITEKRDKGIFLTVLGFGMDNYKDNRMETLADQGNGTYAYIDGEKEAGKIFVQELEKTLYTIAKDVKIQVEFNPEEVKEYRLVGYENRTLNNEDFEDDTKDAGELGCGANVTAFYEIVPSDGENTSDLKYQNSVSNGSDELMTVKVRYKEPTGDESKLIEKPVSSDLAEETSDNFRFAASVAELGMILNSSEFKGNATYDTVTELAQGAMGEDEFGFRTEYMHLVDLLKFKNEYSEIEIPEQLHVNYAEIQ